MASLIERIKARVGRIRAKLPVLDHLLSMIGHYGTVNGNAQAGAVTYFGFLSVFPILALAFFVVGSLSKVYYGLNDLETAINSVLPGIVGNGPNQIDVHTFQNNANAIGLIGVIGLLYAGLGWLSSMRSALEVMFEKPQQEKPNFFVGKARDLMVLAVIGATMLVSVAVSGAITGFAKDILKWLGLADRPINDWLLFLVGHGLGILVTTLLFIAMFVLLARPGLPRRALVESAILGAVAFEVLKGLSVYLIQLTHGNPAFRTFGVALILLVWINYTTRVVMFAAAWAYTHPATYEARAAEWLRAPGAAFADPEVEAEPMPEPSPAAEPAPEPDREPAASTSSGEIPEQPPAGRGRHALRRQRSTD